MDTTREDRIEEMRVAQQVAGCIVVMAFLARFSQRKFSQPQQENNHTSNKK